MSKVMRIGKILVPGDRVIIIEGQELEAVELFKYLGAHIHERGIIDCEIRERIAAAGRLFNALQNSFVEKQEVSKETNKMVYKTIFLPTLTYSSES